MVAALRIALAALLSDGIPIGRRLRFIRTSRRLILGEPALVLGRRHGRRLRTRSLGCQEQAGRQQAGQAQIKQTGPHARLFSAISVDSTTSQKDAPQMRRADKGIGDRCYRTVGPLRSVNTTGPPALMTVGFCAVMMSVPRLSWRAEMPITAINSAAKSPTTTILRCVVRSAV